MKDTKSKSRLYSDLPLFILFFIIGVSSYWLFNWLQKSPEFINGDYSQYFSNHQNHVIAYTTKDCSYCILLKDYFSKNNIQYMERDIEKSPEAKSQYQSLGEYGTPLIIFKDKLIVGFRRELIATELKRLELLKES